MPAAPIAMGQQGLSAEVARPDAAEFSLEPATKREGLWCENCVWIVKSLHEFVAWRQWAPCSWFCPRVGRWSWWSLKSLLALFSLILWSRNSFAEIELVFPAQQSFLGDGFPHVWVPYVLVLEWPDVPSSCCGFIQRLLEQMQFKLKKAAQMCMTKTSLMQTWK